MTTPIFYTLRDGEYKRYEHPSVVNRAVAHARRHLTENNRAKMEWGRKSGPRINRAALPHVRSGRKDVFGKARMPDALSYHFVVMLDCSGSTCGPPLTLIKSLGLALGDMFERLGCSFEIHGHTASLAKFDTSRQRLAAGRVLGGDYDPIELVIGTVKGPDQRWNSNTKDRLAALRDAEGNIDGHAVKWARLQAEKQARSTSNQVIVYVTDGEMPAANADEEEVVLRNELQLIRKRKGLDLIGIGIETSSPEKYGLPTLRMDDMNDLPKVGKFMQDVIER